MNSPQVTKLQVDLGSRGYPIHIGPGLLDRDDLFAAGIHGTQVLVVSDGNVAPLYLDRVLTALSAFEVDRVILTPGEQEKTLATVEKILDRLIERRYERSVTLVALGGGVVGDITGFASACYLRGVNFVQAPTTLLAQVDSSVGGKTGVNHPRGKNLIGAFHQPTAVIIDTDTLATLDDRQFRAGLAEVIKYGLIRDVDFFEWLEVHVERLLQREAADLREAIARSCRNKAELVRADEREAGQRALLNLGHTFAHAIEAGMGYGNWLHGEAVAAGTVLAAALSMRRGTLTDASFARLRALFERAGLPVAAPGTLSRERWLDLMSGDKKVAAGRLRLVLLDGIGQGTVCDDFAQEDLVATLDEAAVAGADAGP